MWWTKLINAFRAWRSRRQAAAAGIPVPDFLSVRLEDARNAVKLEQEKQRLIEAKAKTARMEAEQTIR